jgi:hypothetical protein
VIDIFEFFFPSYSVNQETEVIQGRIGQADVNLFTLLFGPDPIAIPIALDISQKMPQPSMLMASITQPENGSTNAGTGLFNKQKNISTNNHIFASFSICWPSFRNTRFHSGPLFYA